MKQISEQTIDFPFVYNSVITLLQNELPAHLTYHDVLHTQSVVEISRDIAIKEGIEEEEILLLLTAALFHDTGFLRRYKNHEDASCDIAMEMLPDYGYTASQIAVICDIIQATKLPNNPKNKLEQIICDADLHYLGTDNYHPIAQKLFFEFRKQGLVKTNREWQQKQLLFLSAHRFFTATAQSLYNDKKLQHLKTLKETSYKDYHIQVLLKDCFLVIFGVLTAGFALKGFLVPNHFFDGGLTGISLLLHELYHFNLAYVIIAVNLPFIVAGYFSVNKRFAYKTLVAVILLGLCLLFVPYPTITSDKLLISIFGGVFLGLGIGSTMRAGCALDGIEVLALYTLKRTSFTITEIILGINIIIFFIAAFKFGLEAALYSVLTYFVASKMIDYVIEGIQAYTGVTIISSHSEEIKHKLVNELGRGITVYKGERGFLPGNFNVSMPCDIIFTIVTRMELRRLKNLVYDTDAKAFVYVNTIREASGGIIKRKENH